MTMFYLAGANNKYDSHSQCLARVMVINEAHVYLHVLSFSKKKCTLHTVQWSHIIKTTTENIKSKLICQKYSYLHVIFIFK